MASRQSGAVDRALELIRNGASPYAAAKAQDIRMTTIYRALQRAENAEVNAIWRARKAAEEAAKDQSSESG